MFEHQFGRVKPKKQYNKKGALTIIQQSINQNLPDINQSKIYMNEMNDFPTPKGYDHPKILSPRQHRHEQDHYNSPYPMPGSQSHRKQQCSACHRRKERRHNFKASEAPPQNYPSYQKNQDQQQYPQVSSFHQRNHSLPPVMPEYYQ